MSSLDRTGRLLCNPINSSRIRSRNKWEAGLCGRIQFPVKPFVTRRNEGTLERIPALGRRIGARLGRTSPMKVMTILGTRPEIIRLSLIIPKLDRWTDHTLLHTGQNYEPELDSVFFENMKIRRPNGHIDSRSETTFGQVAKILEAVEVWLDRIKPDACLILGDTNSGLSAIVAEKMGVPVFHMEAGNRCFDRRVPEEHNRKIIDHVSTWLLPYVENSRLNLVHEGISKEAIFVSRNPIFQVLQNYGKAIAASSILERLDVQERRFFLVTAHRAENVDVPERLAGKNRRSWMSDRKSTRLNSSH